MRRAAWLIAMLGASAVSADPAAPAVVESAAPADAVAPVPVEPDPPAAPVVTSVPAGRRLSPRNDVVMAAYSARHSGDLEIRDLRLKAAVPVVRGEGYGGALLLGYGKTHLELAQATGPDDARTLHRFEASFGGGAGIAPGWSLRGSAGAAFSSDLSAATSRAWQVTISAMVHRVLGPSDALVAGLVYVSSADFLPVLPILGYVHQREGSPVRLDVFLPHHVRAEYEVSARWRGALGIEVMGNTWAVQAGHAVVDLKRAGGAVFGELQLAATRLVRFEARVGLSVDRYTLPITGMDGMTRDTPLTAASFAQLAVIIAP